MRDTNLATNPAVVMTVVVDRIGRRWSTAQFTDTQLGRLRPSVLHQPMLVDECHVQIITDLHDKSRNATLTNGHENTT